MYAVKIIDVHEGRIAVWCRKVFRMARTVTHY
jgi:hypothetical protein